MKKLLLSIICIGFFCSISAEKVDVGGDFESASKFYNSSVNTQAPFLPHYKYSASQTIYTQDELADLVNKQITAIKYKLYNENFQMNTYHHLLKIYINAIDEDVFKRNDENEVVWFDKGALVYCENVVSDFEGTCWDDYEFNFKLSIPYIYTGKNIVVTVVNELSNSSEMCDQSSGEFAFYCYYKPRVYHTYHYRSDKEAFDSNESKATCTYDYPIVEFEASPAKLLSIVEPSENVDIYVENNRIIGSMYDIVNVEIFNSLGYSIYSKESGQFDCLVAYPGVYILKYRKSNGKEYIYKFVV